MRIGILVLALLLLLPPAVAQEASVEGVHLQWRGDGDAYAVRFHSDMPLQEFDITYTAGGEEQAASIRATGPGYGTSSMYGFWIPPNATGYRINDRAFDIRAPPPGPGDAARVAFVADIGMSDDTKSVLDAVRAANVSAILAGGDLSYADGDRDAWDAWLDFMEPYTSDIPIIPARGNHEARCVGRDVPGVPDCYTDEAVYLRSFDLPYEELYYATEWGPLRIIVVDTEAYYHRDDAVYSVRNVDPDEQVAFLQDALQVPEGMWTIVMMHRPLYSSNGGHGSELAARAHMEPAIVAGGADLVLAGHEHAYERTWPVRDGQPTTTAADAAAGDDATHAEDAFDRGAPVYVVSGGGGRSLYTTWQPAPAWSAVREAAYHFLVIEADGDSLRVSAMTPGGQQIDAFRIVRAPGAEAGGKEEAPAWPLAVPLALAAAALRRRK